jgi:NDP-sugar pyrophosphorylase family protein
MFDIAVIPVGGLGTRMRFPPDHAQSKVLAPIAGHPFLQYVLQNLDLYKFRSIILLTGHYSDQIALFLQECRFDRDPIVVIDGGTDGTAAALWRAKESLPEPFFFLDGNVLCDPRLIAQIEAAQATSGAPIAVALSSLDRAPQHPQAQVIEHSIRRIDIFPDRAPIHPATGATYYVMGAYGFDPSVFDRFPQMRFFPDMGYLIRHAACEDRRLVRPVVYEGDWFAIHEPRDLRETAGQDLPSFNNLLRDAGQRMT